MRRVVFEAQHAAAIEQLVLGLHDARQVARHQRAVVEDRLARQPLGVADRQAGEILDQQLQRLAVGAHFARRSCESTRCATFSMMPGARRGRETPAGSARRGARARAAARFAADQHDRARRAVVVLADVLQQPDVHRIGQERMEVEQHVDAGDVRGADRLEHCRRLGVVLLCAAEVDVQAAQAVGDRSTGTRACARRRGAATELRAARARAARRGSRSRRAARGCAAVLRAPGVRRAMTDCVAKRRSCAKFSRRARAKCDPRRARARTNRALLLASLRVFVTFARDCVREHPDAMSCRCRSTRTFERFGRSKLSLVG